MECEDALAFFKRKKVVDRAVAKLLNEKHLKKEVWVNRGRAQPPPFLVGDLVWYIRPPDSGDKLSSRWLGPAKLVALEGECSYPFEVNPVCFMASPIGFLKAYTPDEISDSPIYFSSS